MFDSDPFHSQTGDVHTGRTRTDDLRREADARRLAGRTRLRRRVRSRRPR